MPAAGNTGSNKNAMQQEKSASECAESCYWITYDYWGRLKEMVKEQPFKK